jgi:regulatory protein
MLYKKRFTPEQALQKLKHYCAYQERSHAEVKEKLYQYGVFSNDVDNIIATLIEENYLNEERFAKAFVRGKFRMKQWGKVKIMHALKQKQVSTYNLKLAMLEIDNDEYAKVLASLAKKKWDSIRGEGVNRFVKMSKTMDYLIQKGFERNLIQDAMKLLE